ncbi:hypothetical protein GIB67_042018 [Kingdonia uniflora]|uniref:Uncharacterized protein n=1 Tax=Kingdonia uniflora TaxID=39325 RepID=A0A7J7NZT5_9MAGN|nr:hypothetical protein GIB67_042018 [Kingdonia uniflora]
MIMSGRVWELCLKLEFQIESTNRVLAQSEIAMQMPFSRDYSRFVFDPFKDLWFMEKAQYEINTYGH